MVKGNNTKKVMSLALIMAMSASLTACKGSNELTEINATNKQAFRTLQEVMDDRTAGLQFSSFSQRTAITDYKAQFNSTSQENQQRCLDLLTKVLVEHNKTEGPYEYMTTGSHDYLKAVLDDVTLSNPKAESLKEFSGYFFLTVNFDVAPNDLGKFKNYANYVGLDNCIIHYVDGAGNMIDSVDANWITQVTNYYNAGKAEIEKIPVFVENVVNEPIIPPAETQPQETEPQVDENGNPVTPPEGTQDDTTQEAYTPQAQDPATDTGDNGTFEQRRAVGDADVYSENLRKLLFNAKNYETVFGGSSTSISYFPELNYVFQPTTGTGNTVLAGNGCYNEGMNGLREYNFDRSNIGGTMRITFVFSQDELDKDKMTYIFPYIEDYTTTTEFDYTKYINVPDFVEEQVRVKIEELDRLTNNSDINGLMKEETIEDAGLAFRLAQYGNSADINNFTTKVLGVVDRKGSSYLVKAERTVAESPRDVGYVSQYKDTMYFVLRQKDVDFYINDMWLAKRELTKQPTIYEISPRYRQLVALNLSGEVSDEQKATIKTEVFDKLAEYGTKRILGEVGGLEGIYSVFDGDTTILSEERLEYLNSRIRGLLVKKGTNNPATFKIIPVQWLNGYETQVEVITKELIEYEGKDSGTYMENYYVVSHFGNRWVIDDIQTITETVVDGSDFQRLKADFASGDVTNTQAPETQAQQAQQADQIQQAETVKQ